MIRVWLRLGDQHLFAGWIDGDAICTHREARQDGTARLVRRVVEVNLFFRGEIRRKRDREQTLFVSAIVHARLDVEHDGRRRRT